MRQIPLNEGDKVNFFFLSERFVWLKCHAFWFDQSPWNIARTYVYSLVWSRWFCYGSLGWHNRFNASEEEHKQHIQKSFDCLRQHNFNLSKYKFVQKETPYLGFIIGEDGITAGPRKVRLMRQILPPICVWEVRSFIGMWSYGRRFFQTYSAIAKPLIRLTMTFTKFEWRK